LEALFRANAHLTDELRNNLQLDANEEFPQKSEVLIEEMITSNNAKQFLEITGGLLTHIVDNKIRYDRSIYYVYFTSAYNTLYTYSILKFNIFKTIKKIKSDFAAKAQGFLILADTNYLMTYELWESSETLRNSQYENFINSNFEYQGKNNLKIRNTPYNLAGMQKLRISDGKGLNARFDVTKKSEYVESVKAEEFISKRLEEIEASFSTFKSTELSYNNDTEDKIHRVYKVTYDDENGIPNATHKQYFEFKLAKTVLSPEGMMLIISNGEEQ
jgi:hypothetical protein